MNLNLLAASMEGLENILHAVTRGARICLEDLCQIEAADDQTNFVLTGGGMMSALRLQGLRYRLDEVAFEQFINDVAIALTPTLVHATHSIQIVLERDPDRTPRELTRLFEPLYRATQRLGLDLSDILDDTHRQVLANSCSEHAYLTIWTHPSALTKPEKRHARKEYFKE